MIRAEDIDLLKVVDDAESAVAFVVERGAELRESQRAALEGLEEDQLAATGQTSPAADSAADTATGTDAS